MIPLILIMMRYKLLNFRLLSHLRGVITCPSLPKLRWVFLSPSLPKLRWVIPSSSLPKLRWVVPRVLLAKQRKLSTPAAILGLRLRSVR